MLSQQDTSLLRVSKDRVLERCDYFIDIALWPKRSILHPEAWLSNFRDDEMDHALHLLSNFLYFPNWMVDDMFQSSFQSLSSLLWETGRSYADVAQQWRLFNETAIFTYAVGQEPNPSESGPAYARRVKTVLGVAEEQIMTPRDALIALSSGPRNVVFVDDFVGTGEQFVGTWRREFAISDAKSSTFQEAFLQSNSSAYYCPVICTESGLKYIRDECGARLSVHPANVLGSAYSAFSPNSILWPEHLRASAESFLMAASKRAGFPSFWQGLRNLGMAIAFEDGGPPDASLAIIYSAREQWKPLIRNKDSQ